jgi:hypothetical protein
LAVSVPTLRLHLFFAQEAPLAVILRQGPSKLFRMILWHTDSNRFEDGQWLKQKVYVEWCDLSPDGQHFLYFTLNGDWGGETRGSYTVLCRPPYFTALALFPLGDTWSGGGQFLDSRRYIADGDTDIIGRAEGMERVDQMALKREAANRNMRSTADDMPVSRAFQIGMVGDRDPGPKSDRYETLGGKLYRRRGAELDLIRYFTEMAFEEILSPDAPRGTGAPSRDWHPLDGET